MRLEEFKCFNAEKGFYFFSPNTMRFFNSRIGSYDFVTGYFVTSEKRYDGARRYTVRKADFENGNVRLISEFQQYSNRDTAIRVFNNLLKGKIKP